MWQKYKIEEKKIYSGRIGKSRFWVIRSNKIWQMAKSLTDETGNDTEVPVVINALPESVDWSHQIADKHNTLQILPSTPDRPIVVKPQKVLSILPGMNLDLYVYIPVWVQFYASSVKQENLLFEFPSTELSSTWFGVPDEGELAYTYPDDFYFELEKKKFASDSILCPLRIRNDNAAILNFQRLSIPVEQLNVYWNQQILCTNEVKVNFKGEEKPNEINISSSSPSLFEGLKQINSARVSTSKNILKKSFTFIKSIADLNA